MTFIESLRHAWQHNNSLVCVGLDPEPARFPEMFAEDDDSVFRFCRDIVDATADLVCCFKPQIAHFAALGAEDVLQRLIAHIHTHQPGVPVILDAKRGDIGSTAQHYVSEAFDRYGADAVTVNPYLGRDSLQPFLDRAAQGGDVEAVLRHGQSSDGSGLLISSSRAILYAGNDDDFANAARAATLILRDEINRHRKTGAG